MMNIWGDIWSGIVAAMNWLLQGTYHLTGNYGVAIILLTILVKLVLLPLTLKQTRSMVAMQKIQPEIRKLQEKYKDDKEKLSQEMMKFYKENKVNPFGGCLPLILQMPMFIALYTVLRKYLLTPPTLIAGSTFNILPGFVSIAPKEAGFLWIKNLADTTRTADPTFILIIILAITTWYSQKQVMTDPRQKNMLIVMPLLMAFIGFSLPAGVTLYWLTTNALQIIQQFGMEYYDKKHPREVPKGKEVKKVIPEKAAALAREKSPAKGKAPGKGKAAARAPANAGAAQQKTKPGGQKGKSTGKQKAAPAKGGKPSQVKKPKGPPPQQKKVQGYSARKSNTKKKK
jgi:YidC/Oxa1 family membrane protein insertase